MELAENSATLVAVKSPCKWKSGKAWINTSLSVKRQYETKVSALVANERCVWTTPLGRPVVPDVYKIAAISSGPRSIEQNSLTTVLCLASFSVPLSSVFRVNVLTLLFVLLSLKHFWTAARDLSWHTIILGSALSMKYARSSSE